MLNSINQSVNQSDFSKNPIENIYYKFYYICLYNKIKRIDFVSF